MDYSDDEEEVHILQGHNTATYTFLLPPLIMMNELKMQVNRWTYATTQLHKVEVHSV